MARFAPALGGRSRTSPGPGAEPVRVVGPFRLERLVARGATSSRYRARTGAGTFSVELLAPELASDEAARTDFVAAATALPVVAGVAGPTEVSSAGGAVWAARPWIDGVDLGAYLARHGPLAEDRAAAILAAVAEIVVALHDAGAAHGSVSPGKVLLAPPGRVVLLPPGLDDPLSAAAPFLAPERRRGGPPTPAADVYGLGALAGALLTGSPPQLVVEAGACRAQPVAGLPPAWAAAGAADPAARPGTVRELAGARPRPAPPDPVTAVEVAPRRVRIPRAALVAASLALVLGAPSAVGGSPSAGNPHPPGPSAAARRLLADVGAVGRCRALTARREHVVAAAECRTPDVVVRYERFGDAAALAAAFGAPAGARPWQASAGAPVAGSVHRDGAEITWSNDSQRVLARAVQRDGDADALWRWWLGAAEGAP